MQLFDLTGRVALVTGGVHGYETSGVLGALQFVEQHAADYAGRINLLVIPCVSPWGYERIHRWNAHAIDPNRSFRDDGSQVADPEVIFRGVPDAEEADRIRDGLAEVVNETLAEAAEDQVREIALLQEDLHDDVAEFVHQKLSRRPLILPVVVEV